MHIVILQYKGGHLMEKKIAPKGTGHIKRNVNGTVLFERLLALKQTAKERR